MRITCVWEHNGNDTLLYSDNLIGAFTRGPDLEIAVQKMKQEVFSFLRWANSSLPESVEIEIVEENASELHICDADSDVLFSSEKKPLTLTEYTKLKALALKSARDFLTLYEAIPDKKVSHLPMRQTFYGNVPRTAQEMYDHTKSVNAYYFSEINVDVDNDGSILECRERGFQSLEYTQDYLANQIILGSYDEEWTLRKVIRRFIWHDRIHAKAMYRMAVTQFGEEIIPNPFYF